MTNRHSIKPKQTSSETYDRVLALIQSLSLNEKEDAASIMLTWWTKWRKLDYLSVPLTPHELNLIRCGTRLAAVRAIRARTGVSLGAALTLHKHYKSLPNN
jgi:hypothetical protein